MEDSFAKYGPVRNVWVARRPPGFAFVEMEDPRDAEDAVRGLDGTRVCGSRLNMHLFNVKKCFKFGISCWQISYISYIFFDVFLLLMRSFTRAKKRF